MSTTATASCARPTITSAAEAASLAQCGSIFYLTVENYIDYDLTLDNVGTMAGLFISDSPNLQTVSFANLEVIKQNWMMTNLPTLVSFSAPKLKSVDWFKWTATGDNWRVPDLPSLTSLGLGGVNWIERTGLRDLGSLALIEDDLRLVMKYNSFLTNVTMPYLKGTTGNTHIDVSGYADVIVDLPSLTNGTVNCYSGCASVAVPVLADCGFFQLADSSVTSLSLPALKNGGIIVSYNPNLTEFSAPLLETVLIDDHLAPYIVAMGIGSNPLLTGTLSFPNLRTLNGASFNGSFSGISMPSLAKETRPFSINSTADITSTCKYFQSIAGPDKIIKGEFECGFSSEASACTYNATQSMCTYTGGRIDGSAGDVANHRGSIIGGATGGVVAFVVLLAGLLVGGYILRMRKKAARTLVTDDFDSATSKDYSEKQSLFTDETESVLSVETDIESKSSSEERVEYPRGA